MTTDVTSFRLGVGGLFQTMHRTGVHKALDVGVSMSGMGERSSASASFPTMLNRMHFKFPILVSFLSTCTLAAPSGKGDQVAAPSTDASLVRRDIVTDVWGENGPMASDVRLSVLKILCALSIVTADSLNPIFG